MEWLTEAVDQEGARPLAQAAAELVKEIPHSDLGPGKTATLRAILKNVRDSLDNALKLLDDPKAPGTVAMPGASEPAPEPKMLSFEPVAGLPAGALAEAGDRVVEGVFDGQSMIGDDGKSYIVPPNYASKSKLVEGDMLKLTIGLRGNFIYKQIGPIERQRIIGNLAYDQETGQYLVVAAGRSWKVLKASITYFKADAGDEAVILAPKSTPSRWAAVENVIKKTPAPAPTSIPTP